MRLKIDKEGNRWWFNSEGYYHKIDGPAVEWSNGNKEWFLNGKRHRDDGPAIEWSNGYREWFINGELHRIDGPAVEWNDGWEEWYLNGKFLTKEEFDAVRD